MKKIYYVEEDDNYFPEAFENTNEFENEVKIYIVTTSIALLGILGIILYMVFKYL